MAISILRALGYEKLHSVEGGMVAIVNSGLKVEMA